MTDLPLGWEWTTLGEIADISGGIQKQPKRTSSDNAYPFLRVANVLAGRLDLGEVHQIELFEGELDRLKLRTGDLLVVEGNGSRSQIGRAALWSGEIDDCVHQNHIIRVRPIAINPSYLDVVWRSSDLREQVERVAATTSGLYTLSTSKLSKLRIPLPPLAEQRRILDVFADLDNLRIMACASADRANSNMSRLREALHADIRLAAGESEQVRFGSLVESLDSRRIPLKRADRDARPGPYRYFGAQGVIDSIDDYLFDGEHLLVAEDGANLTSRVKPIATVESGRFWVNNHAHVYRARDGVSASFLALSLNAHSLNGRITGTAQPKLTAKALNTLELPIPPLAQQLEMVARSKEFDTADGLLRGRLSRVKEAASQLNRRILADALSGYLAHQDSADESASALLERIRAERAAGAAARSVRRRPSRSPAR